MNKKEQINEKIVKALGGLIYNMNYGGTVYKYAHFKGKRNAMEGVLLSEISLEKDWNCLMDVYKAISKKRVPLHAEEIHDALISSNIKKAAKYVIKSL